MSELILPGDKTWMTFEEIGARDREEYRRGRDDALQAINHARGDLPLKALMPRLVNQIDFTIDQGPGDEPVSQAYVAGARSLIPSARVVWNDGTRLTVIDDSPCVGCGEGNEGNHSDGSCSR